MCVVLKRCNDMMNVGQLQGFDQGKIVAQGKLLLQDLFLVRIQDAGLHCKERRVFLFEQIVIFSEPLDKKRGFSTPSFLFKNSIKVSCLTVEECIDGDPCKFALLSRSGESTQRYILNSTSPAVRQVWILEINKILDNQLNFLNALASPAEYHRTHADVNNLNGGNNSTCPTNSTGLGICSRMRPSRIPQPVRHFSPLLVSTSTMSETDKSSASIPRSPLHKGSFWSTVQVNPASIPDSGAFPRDIDFLQRKGPRHHIEIKDSDCFSTCSSKSEQKIPTAQTNGTESSNISTMLVTHDYTAVKEDEINVYQGEVVQILASNQQNMFLVFRAATDDCPAAEGWIPSYVLGHTCSHQRHS